ncbi:MAG TPA: nucleotidyltransferase domain-containing protein [Trichocoleus sp.]
MASPRPTASVLAILQSLKNYLQEEYRDRLDRVILFGSQAREEATEDSDIDVLVVLDDPVHASEEIYRTSQFVAELCLEHNLLISRLFLPKSRFEAENSPLLVNIRREGIAL